MLTIWLYSLCEIVYRLEFLIQLNRLQSRCFVNAVHIAFLNSEIFIFASYLQKKFHLPSSIYNSCLESQKFELI